MHTYELVLCIASKYSTRGVVTVGIIDTRHTGYRGGTGVPAGTGWYITGPVGWRRRIDCADHKHTSKALELIAQRCSQNQQGRLPELEKRTN